MWIFKNYTLHSGYLKFLDGSISILLQTMCIHHSYFYKDIISEVDKNKKRVVRLCFILDERFEEMFRGLQSLIGISYKGIFFLAASKRKMKLDKNGEFKEIAKDKCRPVENSIKYKLKNAFEVFVCVDEGVINFVPLGFCFPITSSIGYCLNPQYL